MIGTSSHYEPREDARTAPAFDVGVEYGVEATHAIESLLSLLYERGYYKATVNLYSAFERLVGGLCWLLQQIVRREEAEDGRVQWELLFQSHDKLKPRLGLAQQIVQCIQWLSAQPHVVACPTAIQPHQLLLQDFGDIGAVRSVLCWLLEVDEVVSMHSPGLQRSHRCVNHPLAPSVIQLQVKTAPRRQWQWTVQHDEEDAEDAVIQRCLFEYGERLVISTTERNKKATDEQQEEGEKEVDIRSQLMAQLKQRPQTREEFKPLERKNDFKKTKEAMFDAQYERMKHQTMIEEEKRLEKQQKRQDALLQQVIQVVPPKTEIKNEEGIKEQTQQLSQQQTTLSLLQQQHQAVMSQRIQVQEYATALEQALDALHTKQATLVTAELNDTAHLTHLNTLRTLVNTNERLKQQRLALQSTIATERSDLEHRLFLLRNPTTTSAEQEEELKRYQEIEQLHGVMKSKHEALRLALMQQTRAVYHATTRLDSLPTALEVVQYEKRVVELVDQVALILEETRKYYSTYNTLKTTVELVERERRLMDSIYTSVDQAVERSTAATAFFGQLDAIIKSVKGNVETQMTARTAQDAVVERLEKEYEEWLEKERLYVSAIRECQKECERQDKLMAKIKAISNGEMKTEATVRTKQASVVVGPIDVVI